MVNSSTSCQESLWLDCTGIPWWPCNKQAVALFDIRVTDTDSQSKGIRFPRDVLIDAEKEKKEKYMNASFEKRASFTPICFSVDGMIGKDVEHLFKEMGDYLADKREKRYSDVMRWIRTRLSFAILRANILCLKGSHTQWRSLGAEDSAAISVILKWAVV